MGHEIYVSAKQLTNLIADGNFETTEWTGGSRVSDRKICGRYSRRIAGDSGGFEVTCTSGSSIALISSHVYYISVYVYQTSVNGSVDIYWPIAEPSMLSGKMLTAANTWQRMSSRVGRGSFPNGNYQIRFDYNNNHGTANMWFDGAMLIDLTAEFGSGNEPTQEWCDEHIKLSADGNPILTDIDGAAIARKAKSVYIGVDGVARKVKRAYIGNGTDNKARLCYTDGSEPVYAGLSHMSIARRLFEDGATTVGGYALFLGGQRSGGVTDVVDAFDRAHTRISPTVLSSAKQQGAATTVGGYALFAGGANASGAAFSSVDAYDASLTRTTISPLGYARYALRATTVGSRAIFGGGNRGGSSGVYNDADMYDNSLTRVRSSRLFPTNFYRAAATTVGDRAIFGGGYSSYSRNEVYAVTSSFTVSTLTDLSVARSWLTATTVGNYALFAGGDNDDNDGTKTVDAYNSSLTRVSVEDMTTARGIPIATTLGEFGIIMGNNAYPLGGREPLDIYDSSLVHTNKTNPSGDAGYSYYAYMAATTLGDYAMFAGGTRSTSSTYSNQVMGYTL